MLGERRVAVRLSGGRIHVKVKLVNSEEFVEG
jgi:hypothetical protein